MQAKDSWWSIQDANFLDESPEEQFMSKSVMHLPTHPSVPTLQIAKERRAAEILAKSIKSKKGVTLSLHELHRGPDKLKSKIIFLHLVFVSSLS